MWHVEHKHFEKKASPSTVFTWYCLVQFTCMTHSTDHTLDHSTSIDHCPALYCHHITDHTNDHLTDHSPSYQADILASIWHPRNYPTVIYYAVRDNWPLHNRSFTFILFRTIWPLYNQHATFISFEQLDQYICIFFFCLTSHIDTTSDNLANPGTYVFMDPLYLCQKKKW